MNLIETKCFLCIYNDEYNKNENCCFCIFFQAETMITQNQLYHCKFVLYGVKPKIEGEKNSQ